MRESFAAGILQEMGAWVRPVLEKARADHQLQQLARGGWFSLRRLFSRKDIRSRVELVFFPCRLVRLSVDVEEGMPVILVNGMTKQVFQLQSGWEWSTEEPDCVSERYPLSDEETLDLLSRTLLQWKLARFANSKLQADAFRLAERVQYPYWIRLAESTRGRISLEMVDAVSGRPAALVAKQAYIDLIRSKSGSASG